MKVLTFTADDGTKIKFDEYVYDDEYNCYWVTMCQKCLGKFGNYLGSRVDNYGSGCCSVCGCDTPDSVDCETDEDMFLWDSRYVDFAADEVVETEE